MRAEQQQAHLATFLKDFLGGFSLAFGGHAEHVLAA
jgi:hypothetical protein